MSCKYDVGGECTANILEEDVCPCDVCQFYVEFDPYVEWQKDEDRKLRHQEEQSER